MKKNICRMCKSTNLKKFLDLGTSPLSDNFLTKENIEQPENFYPLNVYVCKKCGLCQLGYVVPPHLMFNENYPYDSSTTKMGKEHFTNMGISICENFQIKPGSLAIDIGSNAGVLLSSFKSKGLRVLGIEPSSNVANIAIKNGIDTIIEFFSIALAKNILASHGHASVITGTNVFAHIDDLDDFMNTTNILLNEDGIIVIEAPYLLNLLDNLEYDTIYHEHLSYLSLKPLTKFCEQYNMEVFNVEMQKIHGGTLRYYIGRKGKHPISQNIHKFLELEKEKKAYSEKSLDEFANKVENHRKELLELLNDLKRKGKKIVGISAPAKGNTLLNYCKIGTEILDYITEKNPLKIGKYTPGMHIPVYSDEILLKDKPEYALILAWNFAEEIIKNNEKYRESGGKFIVPIPQPKIV